MEHLKELSPDMQDTIFWMIDNVDFVNSVCSGKPMPEDVWIHNMQCAIERNDCLGIAMLTLKHINDNQQKEGDKNEKSIKKR